MSGPPRAGYPHPPNPGAAAALPILVVPGSPPPPACLKARPRGTRSPCHRMWLGTSGAKPDHPGGLPPQPHPCPIHRRPVPGGPTTPQTPSPCHVDAAAARAPRARLQRQVRARIAPRGRAKRGQGAPNAPPPAADVSPRRTRATTRPRICPHPPTTYPVFVSTLSTAPLNFSYPARPMSPNVACLPSSTAGWSYASTPSISPA